MVETVESLQYEVRRLRDVIERQYLELAWQQSELRTRGGKAKIVTFNAGPLGKSGLTGNAGLLLDAPKIPATDVWPTGAVPANPLIPNCGLASYSTGRDKLGAIGIAVCGLAEDVVEQVTAMVEERLRSSRNFRPVFLMDITRTEIFRRRGFAYEYFALCDESEKRLAPRLAAFNMQRVELLKRKWGMTGIINFGSRHIEADGQKARAVIGQRSQSAISRAVDEMVVRSSSASRAA